MQINTVKKSGESFLVNDSSFVPNSPDNSDYQKIQKWILGGGIVEDEFTDQELLDNERIKLILPRKQYLSYDVTGWRIERLNDPSSGAAVPQEILDKRELARQQINEIEEATLLELSNYLEIF